MLAFLKMFDPLLSQAMVDAPNSPVPFYVRLENYNGPESTELYYFHQAYQTLLDALFDQFAAIAQLIQSVNCLLGIFGHVHNKFSLRNWHWRLSHSISVVSLRINHLTPANEPKISPLESIDCDVADQAQSNHQACKIDPVERILKIGLNITTGENQD